MPLVRIDLIEGRSPAVIEELHRRVAAVVAEVTGSPVERVRTIVAEVPASHWGIGGMPASRRDS